MFKKFAVCLILVLSVGIQAHATIYLDLETLDDNVAVNLANTPVADVYYASMDIYTGVEPLWGGLSLYSDVDGTGDEMFLIGFDPGNIFGVRNKQGSDQFTDVADYVADETIHLILEVDRVNQTIKLWVDNDDFNAPDYSGPPEGGVSASGNEFQAPLSVLCFVGLWGATGEYSNILISDSAEDHFVLTVPPTAAMIVNPGDLSSGFDQAQYDRLVSMGYEVTVVPQSDVGSAFTIDDANAVDLLLISESPSSSRTDPLRGTTTPVMHNEGYAWDNWYLTTTDASPGWQSGSDVNIVNATHPIVVDAGASTGPLTFYSTSFNDAWTTVLVSTLAPGAELIAQITANSNDYAIIFTLDKGAEMANGSAAPARIAGFSIRGSTFNNASEMTDEAWALWDATIRWLNPQPIEAPSMVAHWPMDDGEGMLVADVVGGNDGTIVGNVSWIDGFLGGAVIFDTTDPNAAIAVPNSDELDFGDVDFSISMMVRYPAVPGTNQHEFVTKGTTGAPGTGKRYTLFHKGDRMRFEIDNDISKSSLQVSDANFITGEWVHIVAVRDSVNDQLLMYADGVLQGTAADTSDDISSGEDMYIGNSPPIYGNNVSEADIDDVRIYSAALTGDDIAAIYPAPVSIPVENFSFELPGGDKQTSWETVPGWSSDTVATDSGCEEAGNWKQTDGVVNGYIRAGDSSVYNLLTYVIEEGDVLTLTIDAFNEWMATQFKISLYYDDAGVRVPLVSGVFDVTGDYQTFNVTVDINDVPEAVGHQLGIELENVTPIDNSWVGMDNVRVTKEL